MSQVPAMPTNASPGGQRVLTAVRKEFGVHVYFNEAFSAAQKDFRVEFSKKFAKNSKLTIVVEVSLRGYMEICYETLENSDKYFYVSIDPSDAKLYVGTKLLQHIHHHRQDLLLTNNTIVPDKPCVLQLEWRTDDTIEFYVEGKASIYDTKPSGTILKDCARLVQGELFVGDTSKTLRNFKVYEVHHTSTRWQTIFEENYSYTLPPQYSLADNGLIRFSGKCIMREHRTGEIQVYYDNKFAAKLQRLQKNKDMTVVVKFTATEMFISLVGAPIPAPPITASLDRTGGEPSIKPIRVSRNLQTHNVEIISGASTTT